MNSVSMFRKSIYSIVGLLAVLSLLMTVTTPVFARALDSNSNAGGGNGNQTDAQLEKAFARDQTLFSRLRSRSNFQNYNLDEVQKLIRDKFARLSSTNVNISGPKVKNKQNLTTQYNTVTANINRVIQLQTIVSNLLDSHNGFDNYGGVTNHAAALETVKSLQKYLSQLAYMTRLAKTGFNKIIHNAKP